TLGTARPPTSPPGPGEERTCWSAPRATNPDCSPGSRPCPGSRSRSGTPTTRAHGRSEERTLKVVTVTDSAGGLGFPGAAQAIQITRRTKRITPKPGKKNSWRTETVYALVTLPAEQASPAELATWIRNHRIIENRLHWVRDITLGKDLHQARTGNGPTPSPSCATSPSATYASPATTTSPAPYATTTGTPTRRSPS
ncbi:MAG: hypothetical protein QG597_4377, partial [Actinomycetota bacterium]|nr:hypothetical protein [Actinomycetota bacterium]